MRLTPDVESLLGFFAFSVLDIFLLLACQEFLLHAMRVENDSQDHANARGAEDLERV